MRFKFLYILLFVSLAFGSVAGEFLLKLKTIELLKINFEQEFYPIGYQKPIVSEGIAYIQNRPPFKIKLIYEKPNPFIILYDGKNTIIYNTSSKSIYKTKNSQEIEGLGIFNKSLFDIFRPILTSYQNGHYDILFIPIDKSKVKISYIILKLSKDLDIQSAYIYMPHRGVLYIKVLDFYKLKEDKGIFKIR